MTLLRYTRGLLLKPYCTRFRTAFMSQDHSDKVPAVNDDDETSDVMEEEYIISKFYKPEIVPEGPLTSLNIIDRSVKVKKVGSFSCDLFTGSYDHDYLTYPEPLYDRVENQKLKDQGKMVQQIFPKIWDDQIKLQKFNFFNMFQLSVTEMTSIFESIGASIDKCYDSDQIMSQDTKYGTRSHRNTHTQITNAILSLINRNCLTYWPIFKSKNDLAKSLLPEKHIQFGGSSVLDRDLYAPIGFCWTEQVQTLGALPPQEWQTFVKSGGDELGMHLITGSKSNILYDERMEHFLLFYRDKFLADQHDNDDLGHEPNPASDPFAGACLLHKSEIQFSPTYLDSAGIPYVDAKLDCTIPDDRIIIPAKRKDPTSVNVKALGQLSTSAVITGMLKAALAKTYKNLIDYKTRLLTCDIVEHKLSKATADIFAIESMLYYIAGIYDGLEDGFDVHMEATILKIVTYELSHKVLQELQQINGTDLTNFAHLHDQLNTFDCFLDGNIYNRLYLSTMGVIWYARSKNVHLNQLRLKPWYAGYYAKHLLKQMAERNNWLTIDADIHGNLHPSLGNAAEKLEYIVKRIKYATEILCMNYGEEVTGAQSALYHLSQITIDCFMLTTMCARASKSYCNGSKNCDVDIMLTSEFASDLACRVNLYMARLNTSNFLVEDRIHEINDLNIRAGGYYAESPLDPNI